MGAGIAETAAFAGVEVVVRELPEYLDATRERLETSLNRAVKRGKCDAADRDVALARITLTSELEDVAEAELAIEAVPENVELKTSIMKELATSPAADPSLGVQMENDNRTAMEGGHAAFELNYPFVYPSMKADNPKMFKNFRWALYPSVVAGQPAHVTIGGIDLAVSSYSRYPKLAFQAALCLRDAQNQLIGATVGGVPPTIASLYNNPKLFPDYPFHADILGKVGDHRDVAEGRATGTGAVKRGR